MSTDIHTDADRRVAQVLQAQFQGRTDLVWEDVATAAIDALFEYEGELNRQFMVEHPDAKQHIPRLTDENALRADIAHRIRRMYCPFKDASSIPFGAARELAALIAEGNED